MGSAGTRNALPVKRPRARWQPRGATNGVGLILSTEPSQLSGVGRVLFGGARTTICRRLVGDCRQSWRSGNARVARTAAMATSGQSILITLAASERTGTSLALSSCAHLQPAFGPSWKSAFRGALVVIAESHNDSDHVRGGARTVCPLVAAASGDAGPKRPTQDGLRVSRLPLARMATRSRLGSRPRCQDHHHRDHDCERPPLVGDRGRDGQVRTRLRQLSSNPNMRKTRHGQRCDATALATGHRRGKALVPTEERGPT